MEENDTSLLMMDEIHDTNDTYKKESMFWEKLVNETLKP